MAIPAIITNLEIQQGNSEVLLTWDESSGATSYSVQRSTDGITFVALATPAASADPFYLDTTVTAGTNYYYQVASVNSDGTSAYAAAVQIVPTNTGKLALGMIRLMAQERADRVNSNFVTKPEWNRYINQSYFELYDLLVDTYEDYYIAAPVTMVTTAAAQYDLSTIMPDFYKLNGVDIGVASGSSGYVTLKKFDFISRNRYVFPQITSTYLGVFNLRYRIVGDTLMFIPTPQAGQQVRLWYTPRPQQLLKDSDILDGISGWTEYVIVDAAIRALQKEESDVSVLMAQKMALKQRIEEAAQNRDIGQPDTISDARTRSERWGSNYLGYDGSFGGI